MAPREVVNGAVGMPVNGAAGCPVNGAVGASGGAVASAVNGVPVAREPGCQRGCQRCPRGEGVVIRVVLD